MRFTTVVAIIPATLPLTVSAITGKLGDAPVEKHSPLGASYHATLVENTAFKANASGQGSPSGEVTATTASDGTGVAYSVSFSNLPTTGGPFMYHLHVEPVHNGNCTTTLAHLDPYIRGEDQPCDASAPQTCQVGDLSGKFGAIKPESIQNGRWTASFVDPYSTLQPGVGSFFGNRSVVLHFANKTRIACGNFQLIQAGGHNSTMPGSGNLSSTQVGATSTATATATHSSHSSSTAASATASPSTTSTPIQTGAGFSLRSSALSVALSAVVAAFAAAI